MVGKASQEALRMHLGQQEDLSELVGQSGLSLSLASGRNGIPTPPPTE